MHIRKSLEVVSWICFFSLLLIGIPLYLCMPLWVDVTYHDLSARNILQGGVHYRDIFETNFPGMVWIQALVRIVLGWSSEAIRCADLVVFGTTVTLLFQWLKKANVSAMTRIWFLCGCGMFYLFETEFIHCQRDGWMLLPTVVALPLRLQQIERLRSATSSKEVGVWGFLEGLIWGLAVWIKPHAFVPALFVWGKSLRFQKGSTHRNRDILGLLAGGLLAGLLGSLWLIRTGTWEPFWDVLLNWNPEYYEWSQTEMLHRWGCVLTYFAPWSAVHIAAIPVAIYSLLRSYILSKECMSEESRLCGTLLSALYLGWFLEAVCLQKTFHYAHAPVILLAMAVLAYHKWPVGQIFCLWCLLAAAVHLAALFHPWVETQRSTFAQNKPYTYFVTLPNHALFDSVRLRSWSRCWTEGSTNGLRNTLSFYGDIHCVPDWEQLEKVKNYLQTRNVQDNELICWYDSTHPLYLWLDVKPAVRFMHVLTALQFRSKHEQIRQEVLESGHRYVVSDLVAVLQHYPTVSWDDFLTNLPESVRDVYPWNQPVVFRAGRYFVHEIQNPINKIHFPIPERKCGYEEDN